MKNDLVVSFSWSIESMQVSEIGGRLIEQYLCDQLIANKSNSLFFKLQRRQAMGDIKCTYEYKDKKYEFYIDIKGKFLDQSTFTNQYYKKHNIAIDKEAEVRIIIGDREYQGKGFGSDALTTLKDYIFKSTNLERLYLHTLTTNERAKKSFKKAGFTEIGEVRKDGMNFIKMEYKNN